MDSLPDCVDSTNARRMGEIMIQRIGKVACKTALRLTERAITTGEANGVSPIDALEDILLDMEGDGQTASQLCEIR